MDSAKTTTSKFNSTIATSDNYFDLTDSIYKIPYVPYPGDVYYCDPVKPGFTGAVVYFYNGGSAVASKTYDFDEKSKELYEEAVKNIERDLEKQKSAYVEKIILRLSNLDVQGGVLVDDEGHSVSVDDIIDKLKTEKKRIVYISSNVVDFLIEKDASIFDGWKVVLTDSEDEDKSLQDLPKSLDGFKDEELDEYKERILEEQSQNQYLKSCMIDEFTQSSKVEKTLNKLRMSDFYADLNNT